MACLIGGCGLEREGPYAQPEFRTPDAPLPESEPYVRVISGQVINDPSLLNRSAPPADPVTASPLDTKRLDEVSFTGVPLSGAAIMLTRMVGVNITASAEAANRPVTVYLKNVSARSAIEAICRLNNLWYREDPEMIRLLTREEYGRELVIKSDQQTRLYYLKNASALGVADMIAALMPDQVEYTRPSDESSYGHVGTDGDDPLSSSATSTSSTGSDTLEYSADGTTRQRPSGGVSRSYYGYSASDVSTNYQRGVTAGRVEQLARTSADRQRGEVTADEVARSTGVPHPVALSVFLRNNCIAVRTVQESVHDEIGKIIQALDTPTRQVLLEVKVLRVRLGDGFESVFHLSYTNGAAHQSSIKWLDGADIAGSTLSFGYLDHNISATLKLLKNDHRLHSVATPMLLCANNAPAEFFSGVTRMITTNYDFETRYDDNNHAVDIARPTVEERNIGTTVRIKPSINADGTVTLRFLLELSAVNDNGANIYQVNSTGQVIALPIDTVDNERAESIVVARHGQAVVMGGLISETVSKDRRRVPVAGDVPVLGTFLGKRVDDVSRSETIMIIVPHIIATSGAEGQAVSNTVLGNNAATHPMAAAARKGLTHWDSKTLKIQEVDPALPDPMGQALQNAPALEPGTDNTGRPQTQPSNQ